MWKCRGCGKIEKITVNQREAAWATVEYFADDEKLRDGEYIDSDFETVLEMEEPTCCICGLPVYWDTDESDKEEDKNEVSYITRVEDI